MKGNKASLRWHSALLGMGVGVVTMVCACAAGAGMMAGGAADPATMDIWAAGILTGSALCAGLAAMLGGGGPVEAALSAGGELVVLIVLNVLLNGGKMEGLPVTILALAGGYGGAVLLRLGKGTGRKRRRGHRKNR